MMLDLAKQVDKAIRKSEGIESALQSQLMGTVTDRQRTALDLLESIVKINQDVAAHEVESAHHQAGFVELLSIVASILGVVLAMGLGFLISRGINRTLTRITQGMDEGANQVASASSQVSSSSQSMAEGASEQAASIEETSSSMEEMASMTKNNAENAGTADGLMKEANHDREDTAVQYKTVKKAAQGTHKQVSGNKKMLAGKTGEVRPDQVIPFDDDDNNRL